MNQAIPKRSTHAMSMALLGAAALLFARTATADATPPKTTQPQISEAEMEAVLAAEKARVNVVQKVFGSVVAIYGRSRQGGGSGVIFHPDGYALTNYHVVRGAGITGWGGLADGKLYKWDMLGIDPGGDIAIIKLERKDGKPFPYSELGDSRFVRVGDWVMAMGNPFVLAEDQKPTVTLGIVSGINRYQPGGGPNGNLLEYGNCIQIDTSINPGNSGGPLFDMAGRVVGINGRGSFEERGRVNVGVGYAISTPQILNFVPDLMATKTAMHGTLDAVFADRSGVVMCQSINLDSPIAKAGLELGATLIEFEGERIRSVNQFKNLLTMLPAGWPVTLTWEREGKRQTATVRLTPLPYGEANRNTQRQPKPGDRKLPEDIQKMMKKAPPKAGEIRLKNVAQAEGKRVLEQWDAYRGGDRLKSIGALTIAEQIIDGGKKRGDQTVVWAEDGKVNITSVDDKRPLDPTVDLLSALRSSSKGDFKEVLLTGGDEANGQRAYRLLVETKDDRKLVLWFSVLAAGPVSPQIRFQTRLLKIAEADKDGNEKGMAIVFDDYREVSGVMVPHRRRVVSGVAERTELEYVTTKAGAASPATAKAVKE